MKLNKQNAPKIIIICCAVIIVSVLTALVAPAIFSVKPENHAFADGKQQGVDFSTDFDVAVSGGNLQKLLINSKNGAVALASSKGNIVFNSMSADAARYSLANILSVRLRDKKGNIYSMNSTDNSVDFGTFEVLGIDSTKATVSFRLFPDAESAQQGVENADIYVVISVDFTFEGSSFTAAVDTTKVALPKGFCLEKISILPGLFSVNKGVSGESYIIPDGCGAQIDLSAKNQEDYTLELGVYGADATFHAQSAGAYLPYFAYAKKGCLVNAIITEGDALSEITVKKFADGGGYLYNTFTVTACGIVKDRYVKGPSYEGVISQSYTISEKQTDYNVVAQQVRQHLLRNGYIAEKTGEKFNDLPFFINVIGSVDGKGSLTSFVDATEITTLLKSRGVRNIALRYSGAGSNGMQSTAGAGQRISSTVGGADGLSDAVSKITGQGNTFWLDVNIANNRANYNKRTVTIYSDSLRFAGYASKDFTLAGSDDIGRNVSKWYKSLQDYPAADVCLNDCSKLLYTDVADDYNRQDMLDNIRNSTSALGAQRGVMLTEPAAYLLSNADAVFSMPEAASCQHVSGVSVVPVLQMAIHGSVVYGSSYMNVSNLSGQDALLKCIEYGAVPSFLFTHSSGSTLDYNAYVAQTAAFYSDAKQILPMLDMSMTSHSSVVPGVYKVTYDYSRVVYVNYNPSVVEVDGIMIPAKDFVII
ncbi:MAG: hypothetical protein J6Q83_05705 [Clostridia bacterium]|nr:hypothetical protein [Clostridia bacterium]